MQTVVVCLHGWGGSKESWTQLREALSSSDVKLYTPDLPGFGSEPEPAKPYTIDDYADWVIDWIVQNVPEHTIQPLTLVGHSHGGRTLIKTYYAFFITVSGKSLTIVCRRWHFAIPGHIKRIIGFNISQKW